MAGTRCRISSIATGWLATCRAGPCRTGGLCWTTTAGYSASLGVPAIDTRHLLWAATQHDTTRSLLERLGFDPDALAAGAAETGPVGDPLPTALGFTPGGVTLLFVTVGRHCVISRNEESRLRRDGVAVGRYPSLHSE